MDVWSDFQPHPEVAVSLDTFDPSVHRATYKYDYVSIFQDIAAGRLDKKATFRQLIKTDLFFIVYFVCGWETGKGVTGNKPFVVNQCQLVQDGPDTGTVDIWAREHGKSTVITVGRTVQRILNDPECTTAIFSYKKPAAEKFLDSIRKILELPVMVWCFPEILYENPTSQAPSWSLQSGIRVKRKNTTRKEHTVEAFGLVEGMPTGGHWDHRIYDDVETDDLAQNPEQLDLCFKKLEMSRNLGVEGGTEQIIGTFYSHCGVLVKLRDKKGFDGKPMYQLRIFPATDNGQIDGKPVFFSQAYLDSKKTDSTFNTQQLCNPTPMHAVKLEYSRFVPIERRRLPRNRVKFMIVDPAGDKDVQTTAKNDKWAMGVLSVEPVYNELGLSNIYLEDLVCSEMGASESQDAAAAMYLRNGRILMLGVERVSTDSAWLHIKNALEARGRYLEMHRKGQFGGNLMLLSPSGRSKNHKIETALTWPLNNSKIHIVDDLPQEHLDELSNECSRFPFWHVDILDMMAYVYDFLADPSIALYFTSEDEDDDDDVDQYDTYAGRSRTAGY